MAIEQTRVIGVGVYSRQIKVLDQTRKGALEGLVAGRFFRLFGPSTWGRPGVEAMIGTRIVFGFHPKESGP